MVLTPKVWLLWSFSSMLHLHFCWAILLRFWHCTACDPLAPLLYLQQPFSIRPHEASSCTWAGEDIQEVFIVPFLCTIPSFLIYCLTNPRDHCHSKLYLYLFSSAGLPHSLGLHFFMVQLVAPGRRLKKMWSSLYVSLFFRITVLQC